MVKSGSLRIVLVLRPRARMFCSGSRTQGIKHEHEDARDQARARCGRTSPKPKAPIVIPHLRSAIKPHLVDPLPRHRAVHQPHIAAFGPKLYRRPAISFGMLIEVGLVCDSIARARM